MRMTTPVPTRFSDEELALIDNLVEQGVGDSRSAVIRQAIHQLADLVRRAQVGAEIAASYRERPQTPEDDDLASQPTLSRFENAISAGSLLCLEDWFLTRFIENTGTLSRIIHRSYLTGRAI